jgi:hypothetical protein
MIRNTIPFFGRTATSSRNETQMIADFIKAMQPQTQVIVYKGVIYANGTPINSKRH